MKNLFILLFVAYSSIISAQQNDLDTLIVEDTIVKGTLSINAEEAVAELMEQYRKENDGLQIMGYRVQIFSGRRKDAFDEKAKFMGVFIEIPISVIYESPDFKTQAGNYRTKLEAEKALEQIWPEFKSAFVVKTKIDLPQLSIELEK